MYQETCGINMRSATRQLVLRPHHKIEPNNANPLII
jgi:hypothetical protein